MGRPVYFESSVNIYLWSLWQALKQVVRLKRTTGRPVMMLVVLHQKWVTLERCVC
jgi:hypothetical protein